MDYLKKSDYKDSNLNNFSNNNKTFERYATHYRFWFSIANKE